MQKKGQSGNSSTLDLVHGGRRQRRHRASSGQQECDWSIAVSEYHLPCLQSPSPNACIFDCLICQLTNFSWFRPQTTPALDVPRLLIRPSVLRKPDNAAGVFLFAPAKSTRRSN